MTDRTTKALLLAIAIGLWMNVVTQWLRPAPVHAQVEIDHIIRTIGGHVQAIANGVCVNKKIC